MATENTNISSCGDEEKEELLLLHSADYLKTSVNLKRNTGKLFRQVSLSRSKIFKAAILR